MSIFFYKLVVNDTEKIMKKNEHTKTSKTRSKKVAGKVRRKSSAKIGKGNKRKKAKGKLVKKTKPIVSFKQGNKKRKGVESPTKIQKQLRSKSNEGIKAVKKAKVKKTTQGVKFTFTSKSFIQKVRQILDWQGTELKTFLKKKPKKVFFKLHIKTPKKLLSEKKKDNKTGNLIPAYSKDIYIAIPSRRGSKINLDNLKKGMANLTSEYNNEKLEMLENLDYEEQPKIWDLADIFLEFIY